MMKPPDLVTQLTILSDRSQRLLRELRAVEERIEHLRRLIAKDEKSEPAAPEPVRPDWQSPSAS